MRNLDSRVAWIEVSELEEVRVEDLVIAREQELLLDQLLGLAADLVEGDVGQRRLGCPLEFEVVVDEVELKTLRFGRIFGS
jgi:hypothetical protein